LACPPAAAAPPPQVGYSRRCRPAYQASSAWAHSADSKAMNVAWWSVGCCAERGAVRRGGRMWRAAAAAAAGKWQPCMAARCRDSPSASGASWGRAPSCLQQGSSSSRGCQEWGAALEAVEAALVGPLSQSAASECLGQQGLACAPPGACHRAHCAIMERGAPGRPAPADCSSSIAETRKAVRCRPPASRRSCREHAASPAGCSPAVVPHYPGSLLSNGRQKGPVQAVSPLSGVSLAVARKDPGRPASSTLTHVSQLGMAGLLALFSKVN
jgi:hypothetical protein